MSASTVVQYSREDARAVVAPVLTAQAVAAGDFVALSSGNVVRASDITWVAALADPTTAPTLAALNSPLGPGFSAASAYVMRYSFIDEYGLETLPSNASGALTLTLGQGVSVTGVTRPSGVARVRWYFSDSAGANLRLVRENLGEGFTLTGPPPADAVGPLATATTSASNRTRASFLLSYLGISGQRKIANEALIQGQGTANRIRICTAGIWEIPCSSGTYAVGSLVTLVKASGNALLDQKVEGTTLSAVSVGEVVEAAATTDVAVKVRILPKAILLA